jgi:hypothetical protein
VRVHPVLSQAKRAQTVPPLIKIFPPLILASHCSLAVLIGVWLSAGHDSGEPAQRSTLSGVEAKIS